MKKEIELSKDYLMLLCVQYVKNVSEGKKSYEINSKIVRKDEYIENPDCIGEIQGAYFKIIPVHTPKLTILKKSYKTKLKKKVNNTIHRFYLLSKDLVEEWEQNKEIMNEVESYVEQLQ